MNKPKKLGGGGNDISKIKANYRKGENFLKIHHTQLLKVKLFLLLILYPFGTLKYKRLIFNSFFPIITFQSSKRIKNY